MSVGEADVFLGVQLLLAVRGLHLLIVAQQIIAPEPVPMMALKLVFRIPHRQNIGLSILAVVRMFAGEVNVFLGVMQEIFMELVIIFLSILPAQRIMPMRPVPIPHFQVVDHVYRQLVQIKSVRLIAVLCLHGDV